MVTHGDGDRIPSATEVLETVPMREAYGLSTRMNVIDDNVSLINRCVVKDKVWNCYIGSATCRQERPWQGDSWPF